MPVRQLYVDLVQLGYAEEAIRGVVGLFQHSSFTDSFETAPTFRQEIKFGCDSSVYSFPLMPSDTDNLYEIVLYSKRGELCRLFFSMPNNDAYLHQLETYTTPNKGVVLIRKRFTDLEDTPSENVEGAYLVSRGGRLVFAKNIAANDIDLSGSILQQTLNEKANAITVEQRFNTQGQALQQIQDDLNKKASTQAVNNLQEQVDQKVTKDYVDYKYPAVNEMINDINAEFNSRDVLIQQTIQNTLASSYIRNVFDTEIKLKAFIPTQVDYYAKALDTGKIWCYGKQNPTDTNNAWYEKGLSELDQAKKYSDTFLKDVTTLPNNTDLNTVKTFGNYLLPLSNTYINMPTDWVYDDNSVMNVCQSSGGFFEQRLHKINQSTGTWARSCLLSNGDGTWKEPSNRNIRSYTGVDPKTINISGCFVILNPVAVPANFIGTALLIVERLGNFFFRKIIQTNGKRSYSQVGSGDWDAGILSAKEYIDGFDSLTLNKTKQYPNRSMTRNNIASTANVFLLDCILDVQVIGAEDGYVYGLRYFKNGTTELSGHLDGWIIEEQLESTYSTTKTANIVVNYNDPTPDLIRGGIQTIHIVSTRKIGLEFIITIDTDKLPNYGTYVAMNTEEKSGYSWIIDKSCYLYKSNNSINKSDLPRKFLYNRGDNFPFEIATFREKTSISNSTLLSCFQNIVVENAEEGYRYMLGYYTNGSTTFGAEFTERWIVFKRSASNYSDVSATEEQIVDLFLPQDTLNRSGNFETIKLRSIGREIIHITVDTSKLPTYGTFIAASTPTIAAWSWMIVPSNYIYSKRTELNNYFEYDAVTKDIIYRYKSGAYVHQWTFGINGANNLPNFKSQKRALSNNVLSGRFLSVQDFSTDWLPPLVFYAENGDVGASTGLFTGGNHASNGDATGNPTAENELYEIFIDGIKLDKTKSIKCYVDSLSLKIVNKIQASNTRTSGRFTLRQIFDVNFRSTKVDVHCRLKPMEKVFIRNDYAVQMTTVGFQTTQLILSGKDATRIAFSANETSGARALYPDAWAIILKGTSGQLSSWIDRSYGNGIPTNVAPNQALIRGGTGTNTKYYHAAFRSFGDEPTFPALELNVGSDYKWRGGYTWQDSAAIPNFDSILDTNNGIVSVIDANNYF